MINGRVLPPFCGSDWGQIMPPVVFLGKSSTDLSAIAVHPALARWTD